MPVSRENSVIVPPSFVAADAMVERAVVGPFASIGAGAMVRDAIVRDAIVEDGAHVTSAIIERAIIGRRAWVQGRAVGLNVGDDSVVNL
jgi:glucose-1-phosphate thymidylyltransferase